MMVVMAQLIVGWETVVFQLVIVRLCVHIGR